MKQQQSSRMTKAALFILLSVVLLSVSGTMLLSSSSPIVGDVESIEESLSASRITPTSAPTDPLSSTDEPVDTTVVTVVKPTIKPNDVGNLEDLATLEPRVPTRLTIDAIGVDASIDGYGINERTKQMDVPRNVRDVGWYEYGPAPGDQGSAVLAAHVDLASSGPGVFYRLRDLAPGDRIVVGLDDGTESHFRVEARVKYDKQELPLDVIFSRSGPSVLTLITCGGGFSASSQSYDSNIVVYAVPFEEIVRKTPDAA